MKTLTALLACVLFAGCSWNGETMNFKFVTSGQNADNVPIFSQVLNGVSLKPLAPSNLRGHRNANGDLFIECTRRSRIGGGLRPGTDVPVAENITAFDFEVYDGSTLKYSWRVPLDQPQPITWVPGVDDAGVATVSADGTAIHPSAQAFSSLDSRQDVYGDAVLSYSILKQSGTLYLHPGIVSLLPRSNAEGAGAFFWFGGSTTATVEANSGFGEVATNDEDRFEIQFIGGQARYVRNGVLIAISTLHPAAFPYYVHIGFGSSVNQAISRPLLQRLTPDGVYTKDQQVADFGSQQSSISVKVYQVSAFVGRGTPASAVL